jgi:two-component system, chemotaxis family, sensor histidine kinase and response regulator PixL
VELLDREALEFDFDLALLQSEIDHQQLTTTAGSDVSANEIPEFPPGDVFDQILDSADGEMTTPLELGSALANIDIPASSLVLDDDHQLIAPVVTAITNISHETITTITATNTVTPDRPTVRVPVEYLQQFNTVFGQLILERNAINLRLTEIQNYTSLMRQRMQQLESSNQALRQWYEAPVPSNRATPSNLPLLASPLAAIANFDRLEMDHYSDLHLVAQEQIETMGQLQEVTTDIELSLQEMTQSVRSLNQTTRTLQKNVVRTQMVPFADVVKRLPRLVRDLSVQFDKDVQLQVMGENTSIDRAILENLSDPLLHLVRNAFDHGIEATATRLAAGKPAAGNIVLAASQRGGDTIITITDDGGGINLDLIRQQLQQLGLPATEVLAMSEAALLDLIFEPGFSTAPSLTELSGRGVGLDVVRNNIEKVRGQIRVETAPGIGTTFTISVPFALSILRVMLLERAGFVFAVAVDTVQEMIHFQPDLLRANGTKLAWQSQTIPVVAIEQGLNWGRSYRPVSLPGTPAISQPTVLIAGAAPLSTAFYIDRFWGEKEVTLRSIDSPLPLTPGFGNSIILGDGRVVPLLDLEQFARWLAVTPHPISSDIAVEPPLADVRPFMTNSLATNPLLPPLGEISAPLLANTILVIDDSLNVRRYLVMVLEKEGYQVEQAKDGQEAVDKLYAGLAVQAVLCDIEMPRLDGYGVLDAIRSHPALTDLPIVMLTSRSSEKHRQLALNLGASGYFTKPYTESELLATLKSLIRPFSYHPNSVTSSTQS